MSTETNVDLTGMICSGKRHQLHIARNRESSLTILPTLGLKEEPGLLMSATINIKIKDYSGYSYLDRGAGYKDCYEAMAE